MCKNINFGIVVHVYLKNVCSRYGIANEYDCKSEKYANKYMCYANPSQEIMTFEWLRLRGKVLNLQEISLSEREILRKYASDYILSRFLNQTFAFQFAYLINCGHDIWRFIEHGVFFDFI